MTRGRRFGTVRLRSGQALEWSVPKAHERERSRLHRQRCTSEDARGYIDNRAQAGPPAPTAMEFSRGEGARATRPASTSVTCGARRKRPTSLSLNGDSLSGARIERASVVRFPAHRREKMKSKILVLGFACLSLVAVAQSNEKQSKEKQNQPAAAVKSPRDIATGQASGRAMSDQKVVHRDLAARDAQSGKATGKKMAQDDWHQQRVAIGDVNGGGKADVTASGAAHASEQNAVINNSHSNIKNSREMMTGQASGKRQHQPMTVSKEVDKASPKN